MDSYSRQGHLRLLSSRAGDVEFTGHEPTDEVMVPEVRSPDELKRLIRLHELRRTGPVQGWLFVRIGFCFRCSWDNEHGLRSPRARDKGRSDRGERYHLEWAHAGACGESSVVKRMIRNRYEPWSRGRQRQTPDTRQRQTEADTHRSEADRGRQRESRHPEADTHLLGDRGRHPPFAVRRHPPFAKPSGDEQRQTPTFQRQTEADTQSTASTLWEGLAI